MLTACPGLRRTNRRRRFPMPRRPWFTRVLPRLTTIALFGVLAVAVLAPTTAKAATRYYYGCFVCKPNISAMYPTDYCDFPSNGSNGNLRCKEIDSDWGTICQTYSYECLYSCFGPNCDTSGGGGGGTGGGGGDGCDTSGGSCPPQCFDCGGQY